MRKVVILNTEVDTLLGLINHKKPQLEQKSRDNVLLRTGRWHLKTWREKRCVEISRFSPFWNNIRAEFQKKDDKTVITVYSFPRLFLKILFLLIAALFLFWLNFLFQEFWLLLFSLFFFFLGSLNIVVSRLMFDIFIDFLEHLTEDSITIEKGDLEYA